MALHGAGTTILILVVLLLSVLWISGQRNRLAQQSSERLEEGGLASLGLAISQSLARAREGRADVARLTNIGSIFTLTVGSNRGDLPKELLDAA